MHMKKILSLLMLVAFLAPAAVFGADSVPAIPLAVYGDLKIDSANAPIGTVVTVFNGATETARVSSTQAGKYFIEVPAANAGANLVYKVNGTYATEKVCANPVSQASDKIDLSITTTTTGGSGSGGSGGGGGGGGGASGGSGNGSGSGSSGSSSSGSGNNTTTNDGSTNLISPGPSVPSVPGQVLGEKVSDSVLEDINSESGILFGGNIDSLLSHLGNKRDLNREANGKKKYIANLIKGLKNYSATNQSAYLNFIVYGTRRTQSLGEGERTGVLDSYKAAFGKLPKTEKEWQDLLKIAQGRWPSEKNKAVEDRAKIEFKKIYGREPNMSNANDNAAITIMAYGLRNAKRNMKSEAAALKTFKFFFKRIPSKASDWDIIRAIAYSGAKR